MPIEFQCTGCHQMLRVGDEDAGRNARCPHCSAIIQIPGGQPGPSDPEADPGAIGGADDLVPVGAPPQGLEADALPAKPTAQKFGRTELVPTRINLDSLLSATWQAYKQQIGAGALFTLAIFGVYVASVVVVWPLSLFQQVAMHSKEYVLWGSLQLVSMLWNTVIGALASCVMIGFGLAVVRGTPQPISAAFSACRHFFTVLAANLVFFFIAIGLLVVFGLPVLLISLAGDEILASIALFCFAAMFVLTYIFIMVSLLLAGFFIIDQRAGVIPALTSSFDFMRGNRLMTIISLLVVGIVGGLFTLLTCGVGAFFYMPYNAVFMAVIYLSATGQLTQHSQA